MKVQVPVTFMNELNIRPGDKFNVGYKPLNYVKRVSEVVRMTETKRGVYAVFSNGTWRPMSTYNKTWWKV